jgi:hypothetical protein
MAIIAGGEDAVTYVKLLEIKKELIFLFALFHNSKETSTL